MRFSASVSLALLSALGVSADLTGIIPRSWTENRSPHGAVHLGDDGVLRRMEMSIPTIARRDDHIRPAEWEIRDAIPLAPEQIRRWIDHVGPGYSENSRRHFEEVYAGVDGRDVHPKEMMNPHPSLRLRSPGTMMEVRDKMLVARAKKCTHNGQCASGNCVRTDMHVEGECVGETGTHAPPGSPA